ncbi:MAG: hypothetical protein WHS43_06335 [Aquificaceae bacterium]|jgi:hypothetical protein|uniref:hypothetical protein n=1 Tax=Hydrogenobacter sp. Uz 6-8 TaxID=3384828 RepID=UPI0030A1B9D5
MIKVLKIMCIRDDRKLTVSYYKPGRLEFDFDGVSEAVDRIDIEGLEITPLVLPFLVNTDLDIENIYVDFRPFNVIFNAICEPDICKNALKSAIELLKNNVNKPIINHPQYVMKLSRDTVYEILKGIDGLIVPKVLRIKPDSLKFIKEIADKEAMYPFIFREVGVHTYHEAVLVKSYKDVSLLERYPFRGEEYYLVKFVDYKSKDGLYRKYRVFIIDGKLYPRTMIVSDYWNIHGRDRERVMDKYEKYRHEERKWLECFDGKEYKPLVEIYKRIKLDVFIVDFGILQDGSIVLFEASPCFKYQAYSGTDPKYSYQAPFVTSIKKAVRELIFKNAEG